MADDEIVKYYGAKTFFNDDVTFYKDVNIQGNLNYDSLTVKNLTVKERSSLGIATATDLSANNLSVSGVSTFGTVDGGTTQLIVQGNARITGIITSTSFTKTGGTSAQYLRADGSSEELNVTYGTNSGNTTYVYPPSGFAIGDLLGFIPSVNRFDYNGTVDSNDTSYCQYSIESVNNRVAVTCYTSEQRATPQNNWFAIWRKTV